MPIVICERNYTLLTSRFEIDFETDLFKFRSLSGSDAEKYIGDIIINNRLYAPNVSKLNDHMENTLMYIEENYSDILENFGPNLTESLFNNILKAWNEMRCVSVSDFNIYEDAKLNRLHLFFSQMWGLYASNGSGICIIINKESKFRQVSYKSGIVQLFKNEKQKASCLKMMKVAYLKTIAKADELRQRGDHIQTSALIDPVLFDNITQILLPNIENKFYEKYVGWSNENEYRCVLRGTEYSDIVIKGVVLGPKYEPVKWFEDLLKKNDIPVIKLDSYKTGVLFNTY